MFVCLFVKTDDISFSAHTSLLIVYACPQENDYTYSKVRFRGGFGGVRGLGENATLAEKNFRTMNAFLNTQISIERGRSQEYIGQALLVVPPYWIGNTEFVTSAFSTHVFMLFTRENVNRDSYPFANLLTIDTRHESIRKAI